MSLTKYLSKKGYIKKNLKLTKTNHFKTTAVVNGVKGKFIVDTGASNTCIDTSLIEKFNLVSEETKNTAAGAGAIDMETQISKGNTIKLDKWQMKDLDIVIFDLSHVNQALINHESKPVHGIIGADILKKGNVVIDYKKNVMYLK